MKISYRQLIAAAGALALAVPGAALAKPGNGHGHGQGDGQGNAPPRNTAPVQGQGQGQHAVSYVFKGTWSAADGSVEVTSGNAHVRKGGFVGQAVEFDLTGAKLVVADTNGDGSRTAADLKDGDRVLVVARLPRKSPGSAPYKARLLVDQSHRPSTGKGTPESD